MLQQHRINRLKEEIILASLEIKSEHPLARTIMHEDLRKRLFMGISKSKCKDHSKEKPQEKIMVCLFRLLNKNTEQHTNH